MSKINIKVGLIGFGFIGKVHAQSYNAIPFCYPAPSVNAKVAAVLRVHTGHDQEFLASLGNPLITDDPNIFYEQDLDMVDICTPNIQHLELGLAAIAHNKHLYIEKPLGWNLDHARQIANATKKTGILSHTAFNSRYYPAIRQAKAILASGLIGEIYTFNGRIYHNSYMNPQRPISWRLQFAPSGGGALADLGVHVIDMTRYLLGEAEWVQCHAKTFIKERPISSGSNQKVKVDVDDWAICTVGLQNGAIGTIEATRMSGGLGNNNRIEIFGSLGSVVVDLDEPSTCQYYDQNSKQVHIGKLEIELPESEHETKHLWPTAKMSLGPFIDAHTACIYDFLNCINDDTPSMLNFDDAVKSQEILEAGYLSAKKEGSRITLPLN